MAALSGGVINTTETTRSMPDGTPLPAGIYQGIIVKTGQRETAAKNGNAPGMMVEIEFDITSPQEFANAGRKFWDRFNILNASADAMRIGRECLADLGLACGYEVLEDDEQMQSCEVIMRLAVEEGKDYVNRQGVTVKGKPQNRCLKYWPVGTNVEEAERLAKEAKKAAPAAGAATPAQPSGSRWPTKAAPAAAAAPAPPATQSQTAALRPAVATTALAATSTAQAGTAAPWKRAKQ